MIPLQVVITLCLANGECHPERPGTEPLYSEPACSMRAQQIGAARVAEDSRYRLAAFGCERAGEKREKA